jgi:hypothetical protein
MTKYNFGIRDTRTGLVGWYYTRTARDLAYAGIKKDERLYFVRVDG